MGRLEDRMQLVASGVTKQRLVEWPKERGFVHFSHRDGSWTVYASRDAYEVERRRIRYLEENDARATFRSRRL